MPKVRWVLLYGFCSKFHTLSSNAKSVKNRLRSDKVTESIKVGTFLRHSVEEKRGFKPPLAPTVSAIYRIL